MKKRTGKTMRQGARSYSAILAITVLLCILLCGCGKSDAVVYAESLISGINAFEKVAGEAETEELSATEIKNIEKIVKARETYDALKASDKKKVENYAVLVNAEDDVVTYVKDVIELIGEYDATLGATDRVSSARAIYDVLPEGIQEKIENYDSLEKNELAAVEEIARLIENIGTPEPDVDYYAEVAAATVFYEVLNDYEKGLVTNSAQLETAQKAADELMNASWEKAFYVDSFNEPTDEWYLRGTFHGTFSNSATSGSDLTVYAFFDRTLSRFSMSGGYFKFRMIEYDTHIANLYGDDAWDYSITVKIGNKTYEDQADFISDNDLCIMAGNAVYAPILNALDNGDEISCVIENTKYPGSKYRFVMDSSGLANIPHSWKGNN